MSTTISVNRHRTPQKILVPVDLSHRSEVAIEYAATLAACFDAQLVLFTNIDDAERAALQEYATAEECSVPDAAEAQLRRLAHVYAPDRECTIEVRFEDHAGEGILAAAHRQHADAIVMASHGRTGMTRWRLGSMAEKIARGADVPVTIIPARDL